MRRKITIALLAFALALTGAACASKPLTNGGNVNTNGPSILPENQRLNQQARIETSRGTFVVELFGNEAPLTVSNFITLARRQYFDGLTFHRYVPDFVIQGGDPTGTGRGGPGYEFADEPVTRAYTKGMVAMANRGPNTNGSQFFVVLEDQPTLPKSYTIFGRVTSGMDIVSQLRQGDRMTKVTIEPTGT